MVDWFSGMETEVWSWSTLRESSLTSCWLWLSSDRSSEYSSSSLRKKGSQLPLKEMEDKSPENLSFKDKERTFTKKTGRSLLQATWSRIPFRQNRWAQQWPVFETEGLLLCPYIHPNTKPDSSKSLLTLSPSKDFLKKLDFFSPSNSDVKKNRDYHHGGYSEQHDHKSGEEFPLGLAVSEPD